MHLILSEVRSFTFRAYISSVNVVEIRSSTVKTYVLSVDIVEMRSSVRFILAIKKIFYSLINKLSSFYTLIDELKRHK